MIELKDITPQNFDECIGLETADDQKGFVAANLMSIAQAKVFPDLDAKSVYDGKAMVGFVMYGIDHDKNRHYLVRLMIDKKYQRNGYGRLATKAVIERLKNTEGCESVYLSFVDGNEAAEKLYKSVGFVRTGELDKGEIVMRYEFEGNE
jgi:diamine N-acetyltransferase